MNHCMWDVSAHVIAGIQRIELPKGSNAWAAILGPNLQEGVGGFGETVPEALRDLAAQIERERWEPIDGKLPLVALARSRKDQLFSS
jgi:hypothetical protein